MGIHNIKYLVFFTNRIQLQFGQVWSTRKGDNIGSSEELLLADNETITHVRYWKMHTKTDAVEFTTSKGKVYGPWGTTDAVQVQSFQVCCMKCM